MNKNMTTWMVPVVLAAAWSLLEPSTVSAKHRHRRCCPLPVACCSTMPTCGGTVTAMANPVSVGAAAAPVPPEEKATLYSRLGGEPAIKAVVDDFVGRAAANPKVNFARAGSPVEWKVTDESVAKLKKHLVQLVCAVTGGPQKYEGREM